MNIFVTKVSQLFYWERGVTYDTGGMSIKENQHLFYAKADMAGMASIISFLIGNAKLDTALKNKKPNHNFICYLPISENNIGIYTNKVGDIIKSHKGLTVEITNTDGEGRLMMADCLSHICEKYPDSVIMDLATLTGQESDVSCNLFSTISGTNSSDIVEEMIDCGNKINEKLVHIPLMEEFDSKIKSYSADIVNCSTNCKADLIISGIFLSKFINKNTKWVHVDIAGPSYISRNDSKLESTFNDSESTGIGTRLLFEYFN